MHIFKNLNFRKLYNVLGHYLNVKEIVITMKIAIIGFNYFPIKAFI